ncbi:MAG: VOC family protein [Chromatiales bacterium]|nr:VOC family protein [Chromatiales bacterium]
MTIRCRFHLAFPVSDLGTTEHFYVERLGCRTGRRSERWIDFDLGGHQITAHLADDCGDRSANTVDGDQVPVPHFGLILSWDDWQELASRLEGLQTNFVISPRVRFAGQAGEQATMFLRDPSGNALEFKAFRDQSGIFALQDTAPEPPG